MREVTFTADEADYVAANRLWHGHSARQRLLLWLGLAVAGAAIAIIVFETGRGTMLLGAIDDVAAMILFAVVMLGVRFATPALLPRQVRRMMAQNVALREPMHCSWDEDGIYFAGSNGTADLRWSRLHRWLEDETTFVFLQTDRLMFIVPRRALSDEQASDLRATTAASGLTRR